MKKIQIILIVTLIITLTLLTVGCNKKNSNKQDKDKEPVSAEQEIEDKIYGLGDEVKVKDWEIVTIIGVKELEVDEYDIKEGINQILAVDYTYQNLIEDRDMKVSDTNFNVYDEEGNLCEEDDFPPYENSPIETIGKTRGFGSKVVVSKIVNDKIKVEFDTGTDRVVEFELNVGEIKEISLNGELPDYGNMFSVGEEIEVETKDGGKYSLTIDSVNLVEERNEFAGYIMEPKTVYKIRYTYKNIDGIEFLDLSNSDRFSFVDKYGNMGFTYGLKSIPSYRAKTTVDGQYIVNDGKTGMSPAAEHGESITEQFIVAFFTDTDEIVVVLKDYNIEEKRYIKFNK